MDVYVVGAPAEDAARRIARSLAGAVRRRGVGTLAVSGGSTAPPMLDALAGAELDWRRIGVWQVDERIAPDGHPARNANQLDALLGVCAVHPMPVTANDLRDGARRYARGLPERFDVVHLGLGADGHTASWPPGDDDVRDSRRPVELVGLFNGWERMTLTRRVVNAARRRIVLTTGAAKRPMVERWLAGDGSIPVAGVRRTRTALVVDDAAAPRTPSR